MSEMPLNHQTDTKSVTLKNMKISIKIREILRSSKKNHENFEQGKNHLRPLKSVYMKSENWVFETTQGGSPGGYMKNMKICNLCPNGARRQDTTC